MIQVNCHLSSSRFQPCLHAAFKRLDESATPFLFVRFNFWVSRVIWNPVCTRPTKLFRTSLSHLWCHSHNNKLSMSSYEFMEDSPCSSGENMCNSSFCCMQQLGLSLLSRMDASPSQSYIPLPSILLAAPMHSLLWLKRDFGVHFLFKVTITPSTWWQVESRTEWPTHLYCSCSFV